MSMPHSGVYIVWTKHQPLYIKCWDTDLFIRLCSYLSVDTDFAAWQTFTLAFEMENMRRIVCFLVYTFFGMKFCCRTNSIHPVNLCSNCILTAKCRR